jgi:hydroxymethylpyrimidine pyrophosphatase-like HAD family hydrolase
MAVGDQDNDASMVAWAGVGVAMGNGSPATKAAAGGRRRRDRGYRALRT